MDLLKAAQSGSLKDVEEAVKSQGIWTDYVALNTTLASGNIDIAKFLISQNCRVNKPVADDKFESTPLHKAVELKDIDLVKLLLQSKASITAVAEGGNTPLHLAFIRGLSEIVNLLVEYINQISEFANCKNDFGLSHLHISCTTEYSKVIEKYLKANVNIEGAVNEDSPKWAGYTAYHFATKYKSLPAIRVLSNSTLQYQSVKKDKDGQTPRDSVCSRLVDYSIMAHVMSERRNMFRVENFYFQSQSDIPKRKVVDQPTAFHLACMRGDSHLIKAFLERGAPVNIPVMKQMNICPLYSPLHFAVESGCKESVQLLLEYGADLPQTNGYKMTALHLAMYNKNGLVYLLYSRIENKEENLKDANGLSYFHVAVSVNDLKLVKKMLDEKQVDVNSQISLNHRGFSLYTPLHFAVQYQNPTMVKLLVEHGANVNVVSSRGTPLEVAFSESPCEYTFDMFELLLELGPKADPTVGKQTLIHQMIRQAMSLEAESRDPTDNRNYADPYMVLCYVERVIELGYDVNAKDENGNTALHFASRESSLCVKELLQHGADVNVENNEGKCATLFRYGYYKAEDAVMYHHLQNLKALGWKINPKLEEGCDELLKKWLTARTEEDIRYCQYERCEVAGDDRDYKETVLEEKNRNRNWDIQSMKETKIDEKISLYEFMRLEGEELGAYARNERLKMIVENWVELSSTFRYLIKLQYRRSQENACQNLKNEDAVKNRVKRKRVQ